jgi:glycosyltransferase involved in cell wall biosynthesis
VGRFSAVKNHTFLLDIFAELKRQNGLSFLLLVGDGTLRAETEQKAAALGLSDSVIFTGIRTDVPDLMQAMDCFVFPSLYEGLPLTLVEAQAAGLPCIVSDGVPEECAKTTLVKRLSLSASVPRWAGEVLATQAHSRESTYDQLAEAGFDIFSNAKWLQNFYLGEREEA